MSHEQEWGCGAQKNDENIPLKDACALSFFKGALLDDPKHILQKIGEHTQAGYEAIEVEASGKKVTYKKASECVVPEELQARLD